MLQSGHFVSAAGKAEATKGAALQIVFTTGRRIAITPREITRLLKDPAVIVFLLVAVFLTFYVNPHADVRQMPIGQRFAVITLTSMVSIAALLIPVVLMAPAWRRFSTLPMPSLLPIFISIPLTEAFSRLLLQVVWGYPSFGWSEFVEPLLPNLIMLVVFDVLFSLFVLPTTS